MIRDNYVRAGKVTNVVDGDTIDVLVDLGIDNIFIKKRFRIRRINSPEKFGATKEQGLAAKQFTTDTLLNKDIVIQSCKDKTMIFEADSFGRFLAEIYYDTTEGQINFSDQILVKGLAVPFMDK